MKAGKDSVISLKFISTTVDSMNSPTTTRAADVAWLGISENTGKKKAAIAKHPAQAMAVRPVLPPSATPAELSTKVVTVDVPTRAPIVVPTESANRAFDAFSRLPFSSNIFALVATPVRVPRVSNKSTNKNENRTENISKLKTFEKSSLKAIGEIDGGSDTSDPSGRPVTPRIRDRIVDTKIPHKRAPFTFLVVKTTITIRAKKNTIDSLLEIFPKDRAGSAFSIMPAFNKPISAINRPIPTDTAFLSVDGIELNIASLTPNRDKIMNKIPSKNTAVRANCQGWPIFITTV